MNIELLAQAWICTTCGHVVQGLMGMVVGGEKSAKETYCFPCWGKYVSREFHLPKHMRLKLRHVRMMPVAAVKVAEGA